LAHIVYGAALGNFNDPISMLDFVTLHLVTKTATFGKAVDAAGIGVSFSGSGLTYGAGTVTAGVITGVNFFDASGAALVTITEANFDAAVVVNDVLATQSGIKLFAGNDLVEGSVNRDLIAGGLGNDTVHGGGGSDLIFAMGGRDVLFGDKGADYFAFKPNHGADKIMDFADNDLKSDDLILVSKANYAAMTVTQSGNNVVLDFGGKGSLVIVGTTVDHIGADDFAFSVPGL
jgi:Ca2+-binding RTX toxin-like protein